MEADAHRAATRIQARRRAALRGRGRPDCVRGAQARWRGCRTRARVVTHVRRAFEQLCAALEPGGDTRVEWRSPAVLCMPQLPPSMLEPPHEDGAAGHADAPHGLHERREDERGAAAEQAGVEARRRELEDELAWAQAALAARRAQLRDQQGRGETSR